MTADAQTFTAAELERMLDWYRALPLCHNVVSADDELAHKVALQIGALRASPAGRPNP
jgi:carbon monoxide dehydrogenase subunit G